MFSLSLISSSCSIRKNNVEEIKELPKQEIINAPVIPKEKEVSARGKVLCFERAKQEKNEFHFMVVGVVLQHRPYHPLLTISGHSHSWSLRGYDLHSH